MKIEHKISAASIDAVDSFKKIAIKIRRNVLLMLYSSKAGHLGSNMSMIEILIAIYSSIDCQRLKLKSLDRSRVFVSKGHSAAATFATLSYFGVLERSALETYHLQGSLLTGHVNHRVSGIQHSTGALGHGINVAVGCALGLRSKQLMDSDVFVILGDGELQEGSVWEAMMFAAHNNLSNLITLVDNNRISSITETKNVINIMPFREKFESFGLAVFEVDGHQTVEIIDAINEVRRLNTPGIIICNTTKGRDIPFAENEAIWHYKTLSDELLDEANNYLDSLERAL